MSDEPREPADDADKIELRLAAADVEHAAKLAGDIPPRPAPDQPVAAKVRRKGRHGVALQETPSTGHEWDGITEYDNPMPRWWLWTFYATIVWAIGYVVAYPAIPLVTQATQGLLQTDTREEVAAEIDRFAQANGPVQAALVAAPLEEVTNDPQLTGYATNAGAALYRTWCAQCHGAGAAGGAGYPNLLDDSWLWGGSLTEIHQTLQHGIRDPLDPETRYSEMPRFGTDGLLDQAQIVQVTDHVLSLSGLPHDAARAAEGAAVFADNCAACHMEDGSGSRDQGAPALNDQVWLYGSDRDTLDRIISEGPFGVMPAWSSRLSEADLRALAVYVHGLGGGE